MEPPIQDVRIYTKFLFCFLLQKNPCTVLHELLVVSGKYRIDFVSD